MSETFRDLFNTVPRRQGTAHIGSKALREPDEDERERRQAELRQRLATAIYRRVGQGRRYSTDAVARRLGCSPSLIQKTANAEATDYRATGEVRMLQMILEMAPDFANEILRPYGVEVRPVPGMRNIHPFEAAEILGAQGLTIIRHCQDFILDPDELSEQDAMLSAAIPTLSGYHDFVIKARKTRRHVDLTDPGLWRSEP